MSRAAISVIAGFVVQAVRLGGFVLSPAPKNLPGDGPNFAQRLVAA